MTSPVATLRERRLRGAGKFRIAIGEYLAEQPEIEKRFGTRVAREEVSV